MNIGSEIIYCLFTKTCLFYLHIPQAKIQTIQGHARFTNDPEPSVEVNGKKYTAPHILIATGGQPTVLSDTEVPGKPPSSLSVCFH